MTLLLRRSCAILVMLLTLTPLLAGAAEAGKARPVAWRRTGPGHAAETLASVGTNSQAPRRWAYASSASAGSPAATTTGVTPGGAAPR